MFGFSKNAVAPRHNYSDCSGCSLCLLVCPVWRQHRDVSLTPHGHAKAMQHGASAADIAASVAHCTLCMACEPVCPENIDIIGMILELRRHRGAQALLRDMQTAEKTEIPERAGRNIAYPSTMLLPNQALHAHPDMLARVVALLGGIAISADDGSDISMALEYGAVIAEHRLERFLTPLRQAKKIIVADGLLLRHLKQWLPKANIIGLGEALSGHDGVRRNLRPTDLYVIEPRAYHSDYQRLVKYYDRLRADHGCEFNLDLQRIAIPAIAHNLPQRLGLMASNGHGKYITLTNETRHDRFPHPNLDGTTSHSTRLPKNSSQVAGYPPAGEGANESLREFHDNDDEQARWMLHGRNITRIVVESLEDRAALERVSDFPVVHLADLAGDGAM